jgi:hypothetical protein
MLDGQQCLRGDRVVGFGHFPDAAYVLGDALPGTALLATAAAIASTFSIVSRAPLLIRSSDLGRLPGQFGTLARLPTAGLDAGNRRLRLALNGGDHLADLAGGLRGPFGEFAHLVSDHRKPRPWSPARAASIAALRASRLVWSAISRIVWTMPLIAFERSPSAHTTVRRLGHRSGNLLHFCRSTAHDRHALGRQPIRRLRNARSFAGILADLVHVFGQLGHGAGSRQRGVTLLIRPRGDTAGVADQVAARHCRPRSS